MSLVVNPDLQPTRAFSRGVAAIGDIDGDGRADYAISSIFVGPHQRYEIVLWDRPRNSYFSIRERWDIGVSREQMINRIVQQLRDRVAAWRVADVRYRVRKPRPCRNSLFLGA